MKLSRTLSSLFGGTALVAGVLASSIPATPALADATPAAVTLAPGQCYPAATVRASLSAQNQYKMIVGNRMALTFNAAGDAIDSPRVANVFTSNPDGSLGYNLEGNQPLGTPSTEFCVRAQYRDVRFNDWTRAGVPDFARVGAANPATVAALCAQDSYRRGLGCGPMDSMLTASDKNIPERVMMSAQTFNANGAAGRRIIVLGQPTSPDRDGVVYAADRNGVGLELMMVERIAFTPEGEAMVRTTQTASRSSTATVALASAYPH